MIGKGEEKEKRDVALFSQLSVESDKSAEIKTVLSTDLSSVSETAESIMRPINSAEERVTLEDFGIEHEDRCFREADTNHPNFQDYEQERYYAQERFLNLKQQFIPDNAETENANVNDDKGIRNKVRFFFFVSRYISVIKDHYQAVQDHYQAIKNHDHYQAIECEEDYEAACIKAYQVDNANDDKGILNKIRLFFKGCISAIKSFITKTGGFFARGDSSSKKGLFSGRDGSVLSDISEQPLQQQANSMDSKNCKRTSSMITVDHDVVGPRLRNVEIYPVLEADLLPGYFIR